MVSNAKRRFVLASMAAVASVLFSIKCGSDQSGGSTAATLTVVASSTTALSDGTTVDLTVTATTADGKLGEGSVQLIASAGLLDDQKTITLSLANGRATTHWKCDLSSDSSCHGSQRVVGKWNGVYANADVDFESSSGTDAGTDAGIDAGIDAGTDGGTISGATVQQISWASTTCAGQDCTIMGIKGSGFNEQAKVTFSVIDSVGKPVSGASVQFTFSGNDKPLGTKVDASGTTDSEGKAVANITAGVSVGTFAIKASVQVSGSTVETTSPTIGIRGAKAANFGFKLDCSPVNIAALAALLPPASIDVDCKVKLVDRFNNPVGGNSVNFKTEAGTIPNDIMTTEYKAGTDNSSEGTASVKFNSFSSRLPDDVSPLAKDDNQYPKKRAAEPVVQDGPIERNPRDGLVTIIAYVRGEEYFWDLNQNGVHDEHEPFIDQGEPFVDNNDNGVYDPGEFFVDSNANGVYDGPDGKWNENATIWTQTRILYSGVPQVYDGFNGFKPTQFAPPCLSANSGGLALGTSASFQAWFNDLNLNRLAPGCSFATSFTGNKGSMSFNSPTTAADGFGMDMDYRLLDDQGVDCKAYSSQWCVWKWQIYDYAAGLSGGDGTISTPDPVSGKETNCVNGQITATATVKNTSATYLMPVGIQYSGDDTADAGTTDAGTDDAGQPLGTISLQASRDPLYAKVSDHSEITATVLDANKVAVTNASIAFSTDLGGFTDTSVSTNPSPTSTITATTDAYGVARVRFWETGTTGAATITARHSSGSNASIAVDIANVQQISWVSTTCMGQDCTIMGIRGSGFNEQARVTFKVIDAGGDPVAGVKVGFSIPGDAPRNTAVDSSGTTDSTGTVTTNVVSGESVGAFTVKASILNTGVETVSPTIGIRGAKAANFGFKLNCAPVNTPALVAPLPPSSIDVACSVKLVDRFNNPVGGTSVNFKTEAGTIPNDIKTAEYQAGSDNAKEGTASITFNTFSSRLPDDVPPMDVDNAQYPLPRAAEPFVSIGANIKRNPRDGLVTLIAYVRGEEYFWDLNQNGKYDTAEPFIDQGEPFVDANDNGQYDVGEFYVDSNANGVYDGPNGKWDGNTTIWTETRVLYTGLPVYYTNIDRPTYSSSTGIVPTPFYVGCLPMSASTAFDTWLSDENLNRLAPGSSFSATYEGKGTMSFSAAGALADGFGISMEARLLDKTEKADCSPASSSWCVWKWRIYNYSGGNTAGYGSITAPDPVEGKDPLCATGQVTLSTTVNQITERFSSTGGITYPAK